MTANAPRLIDPPEPIAQYGCSRDMPNDAEIPNARPCVTKIISEKRRGKNNYHVFTTLPGYDPTIGDNEEANDPYWQQWEINEDLHDCMRTYYETEEGKRDNVKVFELGGDCQSEEE